MPDAQVHRVMRLARFHRNLTAASRIAADGHAADDDDKNTSLRSHAAQDDESSDLTDLTNLFV